MRNLSIASRDHARGISRRALGGALMLLLGAGSASGEGSAAALHPPTPDLATHRESAPAPLHWTEGINRRFLCTPGQVWRVTRETALIGWAGDAPERREIQQVRLRIDVEQAGGNRTLAWIQHVANTEVRLLFPGDPRLKTPAPAVDDSLRPWPNACSVEVFDLDHSLDLNLNDRMELPLQCMATIGDPAGKRLLLIEPDEHGKPRMLDASEFIGTLHFEEGVLTNIYFPRGSRNPVLEGLLLPLYRCRFLSRLGIQGSEGCENCCQVTIIFHRDSKGIFQPAYDRDTQHPLLLQLRGDLEKVQAGGPDPLSPVEQAALARAASFFYCTGTGRATRTEMAKALGARAAQAQSLLLLDKLDRFFLLSPN